MSSKWNISADEKARRDARKKRFATTVNSGYGFVSRGEDSRLQNNRKAQIELFDQIQKDFVRFSEGGQLRKYTETLTKARIFRLGEIGSSDVNSESSISDNLKSFNHSFIDSILENLRKLREALLKDNPDEFTKKVYLFSVRTACPIGKYQTYVPSISYLLIRAKKELEQQEIVELTSLLILHVLHFNGDVNKALKLYFQYNLKDKRLLDTINSWASGNHHLWIQCFNGETDGSKYAIMAQGAFKMISIFIEEFSVSFFTIDTKLLKEFIPSGLGIEELKRYHGCKWRQEDKMVIIRERKKK